MNLTDKTLQYWRIHLACRQRKEAPNVSTGYAIKKLNGILESTNPQRPLVRAVDSLRSEVIVGKAHKKKAPSRGPVD
jgi:hypothetical protein